MTRAFIIVMCMYFFARAFVHDMFMLRLAPKIHCILTSCVLVVSWPLVKRGFTEFRPEFRIALFRSRDTFMHAAIIIC